MKAAVYEKYGPPEVLEIREVDKPVPKDNEILVKISAACINYNNLVRLSGKPFLARMMGVGLFRPKYTIPGNDIAGRIEAVGRNITLFKPGDEVFGDISVSGQRAFAEYACVPEHELVLKPANLSFEEAAAVPESALVALQALRDKGKIREGMKVLIYGASGGIGTFAVQIAKSFGAEVTGVCSTINLDMVRAIGADHVVDYTKEDFAKNGIRYDLIVATAGYRSIFDYNRALAHGGIFVATGGSMKGPHAMSQIFQPMFIGPWIALFGKLSARNAGKKLGSLSLKINREDLVFLKELLEAGKVKPVIDRCYPLHEVVQALRYYEEGHARGKVVLTVEPETTR